MKITVDVDKCIAAGSCVKAAPDVFSQDDDGMVVLLQAEPPADQSKAVRQAVRLCPARVIVVEGDAD